MARLVDTRNFSAHAERRAERRAELQQMGLDTGNSVEFSVNRINTLTGTAELAFNSWAPIQAPSSDPDLVNTALAAVAAAAEPLGFAPASPSEFVPDPNVIRTHAGMAVVHLHQVHRGVPVFQMARMVRFSKDNEIRTIGGDNADLPPDLDLTPRVGPSNAVEVATRHLTQAHPEDTDANALDAFSQPIPVPRADLTGWNRSPVAAFPLPAKPYVFEAGPFSAMPAVHLVVFPTGTDVRLGWYVRLEFVDGRAYAVIVGADAQAASAPDILYAVEKSHQVVRGRVYLTNPGDGDKELIDFPRDKSAYPIVSPRPVPPEFPHVWCDAHVTEGRNVRARGGTPLGPLQAALTDPHIDFITEVIDEQKTLNIFYFCNYMHDFFYMLGFDEMAGNFQAINPVGAGLGSDAVVAEAHPGAISGVADMRTYPDGVPPRMRMGAVGDRHTALDADVVFHEYVHGVTNRLVGGRMNDDSLDATQSRGLGEGWSDYFALTVQSHGKPKDKFVTGSWVTKNPNGIRSASYENHPKTFGLLPTLSGPHPIGEVWCATLMRMNRKFGEAIGNRDLGHRIGWQVVVDALKLTPPNPSFLDARDAILDALDALDGNEVLEGADHKALVRAAWQAFADFHMGVNARTEGPTLQGIIGDQTLPPGLG